MTDLSGLINQIPIDDIAKMIGVDPSVAEAAVAVAVPAMVGGLSANAQDAGGAKSLEAALGKHTTTSTSIDKIDTADGQKIVKHVFGAKQKDVVAAAADKAAAPGIDMGPIVAQVLPIIAPIVLAYLAKQLTQGSGAAAAPAAPATPAPSTSGGIGEILGGLMSDPQTQSAIGGLLGSLLGGGTK